MKVMLRYAVLWVVGLMIINVGTVTYIVLTKEDAAVTVGHAFETHGLVPDLLPKAPSGFAKLVHPGSVTVHIGHELTPAQVKDVPTVTWNYEPDQFYTLVMTDPDAPSPTEASLTESHHWLVVNIPGERVTKGEVLIPYLGASPTAGTALHRFAIMIFKQPGRLNFDELKLDSTYSMERANFKLAEFAAKYNLGDPIAGNFYQSKYKETSTAA